LHLFLNLNLSSKSHREQILKIDRHSRAGWNPKAYCIKIPNRVGNDDFSQPVTLSLSKRLIKVLRQAQDDKLSFSIPTLSIQGSAARQFLRLH
jgi:hypothetical protein